MGPSFSRIFDEREWLVASLNYFSMNRDYREESRGSENNLVEVPTSLFYTSETEEAESHTGYLRIIPVSLENDEVECDDYRELVKVWMGECFLCSISRTIRLIKCIVGWR